MILLTRLNHRPFYLNSDLIEQIEATPDTTITLTSGTKVLVSEPAEEVIRRAVEFRKCVLGCASNRQPVTSGTEE
jgi:flagellar protein FlbD